MSGADRLTAMLRAADLTKSYGDVIALRGADLDVEQGQIVSLLGRNGAGKTTMLSIIAGLLRPDGGSVTIGGIDALASPAQAAPLVGIAPQATGIYSVLTVRQNLEFFAELSGLSKAERGVRAETVAEQLGLAALLERRAGKLSGGEARRLHTACALVHAPKLLMLDEPTVGADVATRAQLIEAVKELAANGAAVVYTTHYLPEVEALDSEIVIIDDGRVLSAGSREDLIARHELRGLQFEFEGPLPIGLDLAIDEVVAGSYRLVGDLTMADLIDRFGAESHRLLSVEKLKPDLESVFLAVTDTHLDAIEGSAG